MSDIIGAAAAQEGLQGRAIRGIRWTMLEQVGRQVLQLVQIVVLARLLTPEAFGLVAMVLVFQQFIQIFATFGFGAALIQRKDLKQEHATSVFWFNVAVGGLLTLLFAASAPLLGWFFKEPLLVDLALFTSVALLLSSFNIVQRSILQKDLQFRALTIIELAGLGVSTALAIALAWSGYGPWALVAQVVALPVVSGVLLWWTSSWRPVGRPSGAALKELLHFSANAFGSRVMAYWSYNLDNLLIGKLLGTTLLGIYTRAYAILLQPVANFGSMVSRVLFPAYAKAQDNHPVLRKAHAKVLRVTAVMAVPATLGLTVVADAFTLTLFGPQWTDVAPLLRLMAVASLAVVIRNLFGNLFLSQGRPDLQLKLGLVARVVAIAGIVIGVQWGLEGVAWALMIVAFANGIPQVMLAARLIDFPLGDLARAFAPPLAAAVPMLGAAWWVGDQLTGHFALWVLLAQAAAGALVYLPALHFGRARGWRELLEAAKLRRGPRRSTF